MQREDFGTVTAVLPTRELGTWQARSRLRGANFLFSGDFLSQTTRIGSAGHLGSIT